MRISVVMPTLNEVANIAARALELRVQSGEWEWIVSDGGSVDGTVEAARGLGASVVLSALGRGAQLDAGTRLARGEVLLFLHADTALPPGAFDAVRRALLPPDVAGGNFALRFDERSPAAYLFEAIYALQQRLFDTHFGDSATFVRRRVYDRIGGFGDAPIMEDYAFSIALRRYGRSVRLPLHIVTSSRRYHGKPMRTLWTWTSIMSLYTLGVPPERLARMYRPHREDGFRTRR